MFILIYSRNCFVYFRKKNTIYKLSDLTLLIILLPPQQEKSIKRESKLVN